MLPPITAAASAPSALRIPSTKAVTSPERSRDTYPKPRILAAVHAHAHTATGSLNQLGCRPRSRRRRSRRSRRGAPPGPRQSERPAAATTRPPRLRHRCRSRRPRRRCKPRRRRQASRRPCSTPPPSCRILTCRCHRRRRRRRCRRGASRSSGESRQSGSRRSQAAGSLTLPPGRRASGRHPPTRRSCWRALRGGRAYQARGMSRRPARATGWASPPSTPGWSSAHPAAHAARDPGRRRDPARRRARRPGSATPLPHPSWGG